MSGLTKRIISAVVAAAIFVTAYVFTGVPGLIVLACTITLIGLYEYINVAIAPIGVPRRLYVWFYILTGTQTLLAIYSPYGNFELLGLLLSLFLAGTLWINKESVDNDGLWRFLAVSSLGFVYFGVFAAMAMKLLGQPMGDRWFALLLSLVFAGDIFAYFGGKLFGRQKLMPKLSPNKTLAGSIAGLIGSVAVSIIWGITLLKAVPLALLIATAIIGGLVAQSGDLFISLIKRVADVKDTGKIMPGHGGVLDRLDGVIFAAPIVFAAFTLFTRLFQ